MKTTLFAITTAAAVTAAGSSYAQSFEHKRSEVTLGYENTSFDTGGPEVTFDKWFLHGKTDFGISGGFGTQMNVEYENGNVSESGSDYSVEGLGAALHPYYEINDMMRAGAFVQYLNTTFDGDFTVEALHYGVETMLTPVPNVNIEVYAGLGRLDAEGSDSLDTFVFGSEASYGFTPNFGAHVGYDYEEINESGTDLGFSRFRLGVDYYADGFGSGIPFIVSAEYGKSSFVPVSGDVLGVSITVPFGGGDDSGSRRLFGQRGVIRDIPFL